MLLQRIELTLAMLLTPSPRGGGLGRGRSLTIPRRRPALALRMLLLTPSPSTGEGWGGGDLWMLPRRPVLLLSLLTATLFLACSGRSEDSGRDFSNVHLGIWQPDGSVAEQDSFDALQAETPFEIVLPPTDPPGLILGGVLLTPFDDLSPEEGDEKAVVAMSFVAPVTEQIAVALMQRMASSTTDGDPIAIELEQGPATLYRNRPQGREPAIYWEQCDVWLSLIAFPDVLTEDEAIQFANSMADACPS